MRQYESMTAREPRAMSVRHCHEIPVDRRNPDDGNSAFAETVIRNQANSKRPDAGSDVLDTLVLTSAWPFVMRQLETLR